MEKINIAELLKDCPKGMELDCVVYNNLSYDYVNVEQGSIYCKVDKRDTVWFTIYGCVNLAPSAKCVIFPKGKTTWEGFVPPCQFNDGDVIFTHTNALKCNLDNSWVSIFKEYRNNRCACYVCLCLSDLELYHDKWEDELLCELCEIEENRLASEEEKEKLFQAIKDNGYKWNAETKTLEKLIEPKFKVGDKITDKNKFIYRITEITDKGYKLHDLRTTFITFEEADLYFVKVVDIFDITTLKPFDKVLVRDTDKAMWIAALFSHLRGTTFYTVGGWYNQCIPFEGNQHLLGTTNDCDEFYKTWTNEED